MTKSGEANFEIGPRSRDTNCVAWKDPFSRDSATADRCAMFKLVNLALVRCIGHHGHERDGSTKVGGFGRGSLLSTSHLDAAFIFKGTLAGTAVGHLGMPKEVITGSWFCDLFVKSQAAITGKSAEWKWAKRVIGP